MMLIYNCCIHTMWLTSSTTPEINAIKLTTVKVYPFSAW